MNTSIVSRHVDATGPHRLGHIDGLRGVAILFVVIFHAYARWPNLYPYGDTFTEYFLINSRIAGVQLFFMISGFVILMTLQRSENLWDFIVRRWLRLFPAMLVCSLIILATSGLLPERPRGAVPLLDLLPGLTFSGRIGRLDPVWEYLTPLFGRHLQGIEGAFWSLYVEVRYYLVFGVAYFLFGRRAAIAIIVVLFALGTIFWKNLHAQVLGENAVAVVDHVLYITGIPWLTVFLDAKEYAWFAAGSVFFLHHASGDARAFWFGVLICLVAVAATDNPRLITLVLALTFIAAMVSALTRDMLSSKVLLFIGFISYPLYLVHENMMVALIVKIGRHVQGVPHILIPVVPIAAVTAIAWVVARYAEPATRAFIRTPVRTVRRAVLNRIHVK